MKLLIPTLLSLALFAACTSDDIDRPAMHSYILKNKSDQTVRLVGVRDRLAENDTLIDTLIAAQGSLLLKSEPMGFRGRRVDNLNIDSCDTAVILIGGKMHSVSVNGTKHSIPYDSCGSSLILFDYFNPALWPETGRTNYDSDGPQPKEIQFEFTVK